MDMSGNDIDRPTAEIRSAVDGTPGANDMPGRLEFKTYFGWFFYYYRTYAYRFVWNYIFILN